MNQNDRTVNIRHNNNIKILYNSGILSDDCLEDFVIYYDERLINIAQSISSDLHLRKVKINFLNQMGLLADFNKIEDSKTVIVWSLLPPYAMDLLKLNLVMSKFNTVDILVAIPMAFQRDDDAFSLDAFSQYMGIINQFPIQRMIFMDITPLRKLGATLFPSINISAFPLLINKLKRLNYQAKVITFNKELEVAAKTIESQIGVDNKNILIIDNIIKDPKSLISVIDVYLKRSINVSVFSTYFLNDPSELKMYANIITTNVISWGIDALDVSIQITSYLKTLF